MRISDWSSDVCSSDLHVAALLGLHDKTNLFITDEGLWRPDCYVPAFARRYPFVLGTTSEQERLAVCSDESYPGINDTDGIALLDRKSVVSGQSVSVRVGLGGRRIIKKKNLNKK